MLCHAEKMGSDPKSTLPVYRAMQCPSPSTPPLPSSSSPSSSSLPIPSSPTFCPWLLRKPHLPFHSLLICSCAVLEALASWTLHYLPDCCPSVRQLDTLINPTQATATACCPEPGDRLMVGSCRSGDHEGAIDSTSEVGHRRHRQAKGPGLIWT